VSEDGESPGSLLSQSEYQSASIEESSVNISSIQNRNDADQNATPWERRRLTDPDGMLNSKYNSTLHLGSGGG
jgi:hypothetical protein